MARRRSRPKNPRRGPGHNEQNKRSRDSRQRERMLDASQETRFRYHVEQLLVMDGGMDAEVAGPFIQGLWTQGVRKSTDDAIAWLRDKSTEGIVDGRQERAILDLIQRYSRWR